MLEIPGRLQKSPPCSPGTCYIFTSIVHKVGYKTTWDSIEQSKSTLYWSFKQNFVGGNYIASTPLYMLPSPPLLIDSTRRSGSSQSTEPSLSFILLPSFTSLSHKSFALSPSVVSTYNPSSPFAFTSKHLRIESTPSTIDRNTIWKGCSSSSSASR